MQPEQIADLGQPEPWPAALREMDPALTTDPDWQELVDVARRADELGYDLTAELPALTTDPLPHTRPADELRLRIIDACPAIIDTDAEQPAEYIDLDTPQRARQDTDRRSWPHSPATTSTGASSSDRPQRSARCSDEASHQPQTLRSGSEPSRVPAPRAGHRLPGRRAGRCRPSASCRNRRRNAASCATCVRSVGSGRWAPRARVSQGLQRPVVHHSGHPGPFAGPGELGLPLQLLSPRGINLLGQDPQLPGQQPGHRGAGGVADPLSGAYANVDGMSSAVARTSHVIPDRPPLRLAVGEQVRAGDRDSEWPQFVFVTAAHGTGWVPARHLSAPSGPAVVQTPYDTTELPTEIGEMLEVVDEDLESGWLWCRSRSGREGWVPVKTLEVSG